MEFEIFVCLTLEHCKNDAFWRQLRAGSRTPHVAPGLRETKLISPSLLPLWQLEILGGDGTV